MTEELTQADIDRFLAEAREENRRYEAISKRRTEVVDEIQRLCNEYLQLKAGKIPERCDCKPGYTIAELEEMLRIIKPKCNFCKEIENHGIPVELVTVSYGVERRYPCTVNHCPNCGRKL